MCFGSRRRVSAQVLDDHLISDLEREHFVPVLKPKIDGTLLRPELIATHVKLLQYETEFASVLSPKEPSFCAAEAGARRQG